MHERTAMGGYTTKAVRPQLNPQICKTRGKYIVIFALKYRHKRWFLNHKLNYKYTRVLMVPWFDFEYVKHCQTQIGDTTRVNSETNKVCKCYSCQYCQHLQWQPKQVDDSSISQPTRVIQLFPYYESVSITFMGTNINAHFSSEVWGILQYQDHISQTSGSIPN